MAKGGNASSRNPNLCASCSSIDDGEETPTFNLEEPWNLSSVILTPDSLFRVLERIPNEQNQQQPSNI